MTGRAELIAKECLSKIEYLYLKELNNHKVLTVSANSVATFFQLSLLHSTTLLIHLASPCFKKTFKIQNETYRTHNTRGYRQLNWIDLVYTSSHNVYKYLIKTSSMSKTRESTELCSSLASLASGDRVPNSRSIFRTAVRSPTTRDQCQRNDAPNHGWLRTMYHSLIQQLVCSDLEYYALYASLRPDRNRRLVRYPYYTKYATAGDNTYFRHIDMNVPDFLRDGHGGNIIQGSVSFDDEE